jgi:DNA invertase Pin-like site-specific DNA recombinase
MMGHETRIEARHLERTALVYVRQSTAKQLVQHQESTRRQYQLAETAQHLGWALPRIEVIDADLGLSGASSSQRAGFQRLVAAISLGEVGLVLVTEVSRLSRRDSDWHRVIELCAVFETLIADEDGLYDPRDPNDRLVLGLKGTLFSAELHILRARMRGGLLNKARRGALALRLPVGFRRLDDGTVVQDPDEQVRAAIHMLFERFVTEPICWPRWKHIVAAVTSGVPAHPPADGSARAKHWKHMVAVGVPVAARVAACVVRQGTSRRS